MNPPILIAGPTATGKSEIALRLAERLGGEILSADSMQVYRGLNIGTAKPSAAERARVPHHLIDVCELTETFDAAQFARLAKAAVAEIQARGRTPILCGGTGLYFKAFLEGVGDAPPADAALRTELEGMPLAALLEELRARDPVTYERIDRRNPRRVVRAVEVIRLAGRPFSEGRAAWSARPPATEHAALEEPEPGAGELCFIVFYRSSEDLHARIGARVEAMFHRGLVAETEHLLKHGLAQNQAAMQAIGYRQVAEYLGGTDHGPAALAATRELVKTRTRQFAKRQLTWLRRHARARWMQLKPADSAEAMAERLASEARGDKRGGH